MDGAEPEDLTALSPAGILIVAKARCLFSALKFRTIPHASNHEIRCL